MSHADVKMTTPLLASAIGAGEGLPHPLWRPQMQTFLMRAGIEERDYTEEIPQWKELCAAVQADARTEEADAAALLLGGDSSSSRSSSGNPSVKKEPADEARIKAKERVAEWIGRVGRAYGHLHAALPTDLRQLVAGVPQGYAFGVWSFLEKKYRNTEEDSVMALWKQFSSLSQEPDENFDVYKARVDSVCELLTHAKQQLPAGLYTSLLLWYLQPRYSTAVLTLKTGDKLKDPAAVDWHYISQYMAQYERTQLHTDGSAGASDGHRSMPVFASKFQTGKLAVPDISKIDCYYCKKLGHYASDCPALKSKEKRVKGKERHKKTKGGARNNSPSSGSESEGEGQASRPPKPSVDRHVNAVRGFNRFAALSDEDDEDRDDDSSPSPAGSSQAAGRAHLARVLLGRQAGSTTQTRPQSAPGTEEQKKSVTFSGPKTTQSEKHKPEKKEVSSPSETRQALSTLGAILRRAKAVDTGAQVHTTGNKDLLINMRRCAPFPIQMANDAVVVALYKGSMPLRLEAADGGAGAVDEIIEDVYYHEKIAANLLCWDDMRQNGWELHSTKSGTDITTPTGVRVLASTRGVGSPGTELEFAL